MDPLPACTSAPKYVISSADTIFGSASGPQRRLDALVDLGADPVADPDHPPGIVAQHGCGAGGGEFRLVGDHQGKAAQRLLNAVQARVVDVGEVGHLENPVEVHLGDQMVLRREVRVSGRRRDLRACGDGTDGEVGVGRLPQHLQPGPQHLAESLFLAAITRRIIPLGADSHGGIAGHMSKLSEPGLTRQEDAVNCLFIAFLAWAPDIPLHRARVCRYGAKDEISDTCPTKQTGIGMAIAADRNSDLFIDGGAGGGRQWPIPDDQPGNRRDPGYRGRWQCRGHEPGHRRRAPCVRHHRLVHQYRTPGTRHPPASRRDEGARRGTA